MSKTALTRQLRSKALQTLEESSEMFERACEMFQKGKLKEAENMKELARSKRTDSVLLMREANSLEENSVPPDNSLATD
jgi:hypothetical protein